MPRPLRLVRDTDPLDSALAFPGPESPLPFDDHVVDALALPVHGGNGAHHSARPPLLSAHERWLVAAYSVLFLVVIAGLV